MKKKSFILIGFVVFVVLVVCLLLKTDNRASKEIVYNGNNLLISIDGEESSTLPTSGNYYLVSYDCDNSNTLVTWDRKNYSLDVSNGKNGGSVSCDLEFKSKPGLNEMPVGSYVAYVGTGGTVGSTAVRCKTNGEASSSTATDETEAPNSCLGQNAREDLDSSGFTYGYCYSASYKYYTTGWRIAYIDSNNKPVIVSAGSPECNTRDNTTNGNTVYIKTANSLAMKYCNSSLVDGNCSCLDSDSDGYCDCTDSDSDVLCDEIENGEVDAWALSDTDFYNMTKAISGVGKRLTEESSSLGDRGGMLGAALFCYGKYSYEECGYNNDLIDNGGYYWFASRYSSSNTSGVYWDPGNISVNYDSNTYAYAHGLRPVISLSSSVYVTGGTGTMDDPYIIAKDGVSIND